MASLAAQLSLKDQLADAKKLYQEADESDADNTVELFKKYRELKKEVKEAEAGAAASQAAASSEDKRRALSGHRTSCALWGGTQRATPRTSASTRAGGGTTATTRGRFA